MNFEALIGKNVPNMQNIDKLEKTRSNIWSLDGSENLPQVIYE